LNVIALRMLAALILALLVHGCLLSIARLAGERRALAYPALVIVLGSTLAWLALVPAPWLVPAACVSLALAAVAALRRTGLPRPRRPGALGWVALVLLGVGAVWAAFPDYRYDQWNYHLVVAKAVVDGPLTRPIFNDHVFFTGVYEYIFTLSRWWSGDDIFNHSFAGAFTWLFWVVSGYGLLDRLRGRLFPSAPATLVLLAFVSFALPDQQALVSAKPDVSLLVAALVLLEAWASGSGVLVGFFLVAPLALKITWLHFALSLSPVLVFEGWRGRPAGLRLVPLAAGLLAGAAASAPIIAKNLVFFGNPLHPVQLGPLRSTFWSERMEAYWQQVSGAAGSVADYVATLRGLPVGLTWSGYLFVLPLLLVAIAVLLLVRRPGGSIEPATATARTTVVRALAGIASFVLLWPLFFRAGIYPRFVFAGFAFAVILSMFVLDREWARIASLSDRVLVSRVLTLGAVLLFLPAALGGALPQKLTRMGRWMLVSEEHFLTEGPPDWQLVRDLRVVNVHRRRASPGVGFGRRLTLADVKGTYLLDGAGLSVGSYEYEWHRAPGPASECLWAFLERLDVAYVFTRQPGFAHWPREYRSILGQLEPLDGEGRVLHADPDLVRRRAAGPDCPAGP
jgi:hypothetical protein